ncbi:MAG: hypothetical protein CMD15_04965 [Flavobacteriales bacterium]|jgi:hypothetical protein|nr:hypothetical protein [Flavobacteriales bacterium]|tara:strand:+ start:2242 stop:2466 length:225 start_codon:yes stop_codon:yes gene_type:complete
MNFAFKKKNYTLIIIGLAFIISGFILMSGGSSENPEVFSTEIFSFQRITLAPILVIIGFIIEIFAIMHTSKENK